MSLPSIGLMWRLPYARPFLILLAANALVFVTLTFPWSIRERRLSAEAVGLRQAIADQRKAAAEVGRQIEIISANASDTKRFYADVVQGRETLALTQQALEHMATELGVRATRETYNPIEVKGADLAAFEITMPVSGTYEHLGSFLQRLERSNHFVIVKRVAMRRRTSDSGADLDIKLEAYFRAEKPK